MGSEETTFVPYQQMDALDLLRWTSERFGKDAVFACSFGAEDMVILHMLAICRDEGLEVPDIVSLDTGRLHEETYALMQSARERYGIGFKTLHPDQRQLSEMVSANGPNLFYESVESRMKCCNVRKILPLNQELLHRKAWITGLRSEQSRERANVVKVSQDASRKGLLKISPLADWSTGEIWKYIRQNSVPYNALHDKGYPSIGCAPCTRPVSPGEDQRSGRWWWENGKKECGIHVTPKDVTTSLRTEAESR